MKAIKFILIFIILQLSHNIYSQTIKHYKSDYAIVVTIDKDESHDGGTFEDAVKANFIIIHDTSKSTIEIKLSDYDKRVSLFTNVKYNQTFTNNGNKYISYTASQNGEPYFISFSKDLMKVDNRVQFKAVAYHLKK